VHLQAIGNGRPLVFVHGWRLSSEIEQADYEPIFAQRGGWRRLYPDLPGMGQSAAEPWIKRKADFLEALLREIDGFLGTSPFAIAGTSSGAELAQAVAQRRGDRVRGLLMRVPMLVGDDAARVVAPPQTVAKLPRSYHDARRRKLDQLWEPARRIADSSEFLGPIRDDPSRYTLDEIDADLLFDAPTLIIAGRQDTRVGYEQAWNLVQRYSRATFALLDREGHELPISNQELFAALVNDWLHRVEEAW
jgi:pimeloyl-ACP methyl ester carboxylesterase